jgi:uncharacterized protein (UPF0335 family)
MFKARNDFAGFAKDIGKATAEFVEYNAETGNFDLRGGLAADRMREIANITNLGVDKLQEMAAAQKRIQMIGSVVPIGVDDESVAIIESMAEIGKDGEIKITKGDFNGKLLKDLTKDQLNTFKAQKQTLEERAKQSRTAMEDLEDILNTFKDLLIPIAQGLKQGLGDPLKAMLKDWKSNGFYDGLFTFAKSVGEGVMWIGDKIVKFIDVLGPRGTLAALFGGILLKETWWLARGAMLGMGFNMTARTGMGGGFGTGAASGVNGPMGGIFGKVGAGQGFGKNFKAASGSIGTRLGGVAAGGFSAYNEYQENKEMGMSGGENAVRSGSKGLGAGLGAWGGASAGASIGAFGGPIGMAIGALIGGAIGAYGGGALGEAGGNAIYGAKSRKASNITEVHDGIVRFDPNDKFMMSESAVVASTSKNQLNKFSEKVSNGVSEVKHMFDDIKISISINATGMDNDIAKQIIDDKKFIRQLKTRINEEASMVLSGGILSGKPK